MSRARTIANYGNGITADEIDVGQLGGRRNLIINGAMQVAQRGTSFTSLGNGSVFTLDRMKFVEEGTTDSRITVSQDSTSPDDFAHSLKIAVTTADTSLDAGHIQYIRYAFEGQEMQHINKGTASAKAMTLSFYVRSNKTGTYIVQCNHDDSSRFTSQSYTINAADTWERKTITIPADTSGTIVNDSTNGLELQFHLSAGSNKTSGTLQTTWDTATQANRAVGQTNLMDSTSNTWYITGVQLEVGTVATPFEHRSYGEELALCQRYYWSQSYTNTYESIFHVGRIVSSSQGDFGVSHPVTMRARPTFGVDSASNFRLNRPSGPDEDLSDISAPDLNTITARIRCNKPTANWASYIGQTCECSTANTVDAFLYFDAEL